MKIKKFAGAGLLVLFLAFAGCCRGGRYDIRGEWSFHSGSEELYMFLFIDSLKMGTLVESRFPNDGGGAYSISREEVIFNFTSTLIGGRSCRFSGAFTSGDLISGTMDFAAPYPPFEWTLQAEGRRL
jgi:hypothetical protein